ncbi:MULTISPECIES: PRC-barrel domain-containing protein [unclassified Sulfitobacter]|uniref:PRC-barrel domain-containing protein n=1 Tax=unclassified Sulfitobacter TaxID=196795 RepID=UPI003745A687
MKRTFLKSTVAALALTAGTAFAQTADTDAGAAAEAEATISGENVTNTANDLTATVEQQAERTAEMSRENSDDYEGTNDPNTTDEILTAPTQGAEFEGDTEVDNEAELTAETDGVTPTTDAEADLAGNADSESNSTLSTDTSGTVTTETDTDLAADEDADFDNETTAEIEGEAETDLDENVASNTEADMETDVTRTDTGMSNAFSGMVVGDLVGLTVVEADGDSIGDVDYVIKTDDGYAAVVGVGGFLGLGEHTVAVPLEEISMAAENDLKLSSWTKAELEAQPEVDEDNIEGLEDDVRLDDAS